MISPALGAERALDSFLEILRENRRGKHRGIYSVCSAHPIILEAAIDRALVDREILCVESTSNQVDQFGGYTGLQPHEFATWVGDLADRRGLGRHRVLLGGDHLGPNAWRHRPAAEAMDLAEELVRCYVRAGYRKIHLDCSMALGGDIVVPGQPLADSLVAQRAARLCRAAEESSPEDDKPIYIIGTEVPVPGGSTVHEDLVPCTSVAAAAATVETTREVFVREGVGEAWGRVVGTVVQPGVEFGDDFVIDFRPEAARSLADAVLGYPGLVWEAHSTDYQTVEALGALVDHHFAILKVGPWLTFALREGIYALLGIEDVLASGGRIPKASGLAQIIDEVMTADPRWWKSYYTSEPELKRRFSYSDRIRYYWGDPRISAGLETLFANLTKAGIPESLVGQYFPDAYPSVRSHRLAPRPEDLVRFKIDRVLEIYARACGHR